MIVWVSMPTPQTFTIAGHEWTITPLETHEQIEVECILARLGGPVLGSAAAALVQGLAPALVDVLRDTVAGSNNVERVLSEVEVRLAAVTTAAVERDGLALVLTFADADQTAAARGVVAAEIVDRMEFADPDTPTQIRIEVVDKWIDVDEAPFELSRLLDLDTSDPRLRVAWDGLLDALASTVGDVIREAAVSLTGRLDHRAVMRLFELAILGKTAIGEQKTLVNFQGRLGGVNSAASLSKFLGRDPRAKWDLLGRALLVTYGPPPVPDEPEGDGDA